MNRVVETAYLRLELLENGILMATYKRQKKVTLEMAREIVRTRLEFTGREPRPVLVLNEGVMEFDKEARKYVSTGDGIAGIKAAAILVDNSATAHIISFILRLERPAMPTKVCSRLGTAMSWLETYL